MLVLIFFLILAFVFWNKSKMDLEKEFIYEYSSYIMGLSAVLIYVYLYTNEEELKTSVYYLFLIPCFLILLYFIKQKIKAKPLNIEANQQRYFDEVNALMIKEFYQTRKDIKKDRVEVYVNKESKKLIKNNKIVPEFFLLYRSLEPTKISNINELKQYTIFAIIFKKLEEFIKLKEVKIDYEKELESNHYYAEFFLMELWEKYTPQFNISVANLDILASSEKEREFLGALDLIHLNCVKRKGAVFYYKYLEFKDRIKEYLKGVVDENPINEAGFDEAYAKENDSAKTIYKG
ncbi:hypothetical protein Q9Q51_06750 [Campylobacter upsaliensis]|uniref:Uncharacterized protein n=2 Tax=Campylobacter upsaliensis TaxID=28080 RepID=A0A5L4RBK2_CAMUP|nr:hypothetical protein [Campylobacter upsaliensis]EAI4100989.1 hypothetical protein [Campylobacter jejuni]EAH5676656.1 hypothetical protein [Campylobacter upsaliensis]EAH5886750.1 hypothetical protein [Campylobacter upsaliensis]EAH5904067.1 hypothetical protein [Campylobacter upsaliensis]EAH9850830.1 hypothetical protein [Campylobacter upsaliensis]